VKARVRFGSPIFNKAHLIDNQNIGPFKYRFQLSLFITYYSIDDIDHRLSHGLSDFQARGVAQFNVLGFIFFSGNITLVYVLWTIATGVGQILV
jgi:hypothetical protein